MEKSEQTGQTPADPSTEELDRAVRLREVGELLKKAGVLIDPALMNYAAKDTRNDPHPYESEAD